MRIKNVVEINCLKLAAFRKIYNQDFKKRKGGKRKKQDNRLEIELMTLEWRESTDMEK